MACVTERIYEYENFRFFLRDYFSEMKTLKKAFSHRYFAQKAGFSSSGFCAHVIAGQRRLTEESLQKIVKGLGLQGRPATYFETLVRYNQSGTVAERRDFFEKLVRIRKATAFYRVHGQQYAFYDEWYYPVIRELAPTTSWKGDCALLASLITPSITPEKAHKALDVLVAIGMLGRHDDGTYFQTASMVTASDVPSVVTARMRREYIRLAEKAVDTLSPDQRHISNCTVVMTREKYAELIERIDEFRKTVISEATSAESGGAVYQLNCQLFPLSRTVEKER